MSHLRTLTARLLSLPAGVRGLGLYRSLRSMAHRLEYAAWIRAYDRITSADRRAIAVRLGRLTRRPRISILMPVYDPPEQCLREALDSVTDQLYPDWELCVADDASTNPRIAAILAGYEARDERIKVCYRKENGNISAASNSALELATGEFLALLDHDDRLAEHALYMVVNELEEHPQADLIFSDEDKLDESGRRCRPYFKPDWNPDLFRSQNYINHLGVYRASLVRELGGFRLGYEGSQDYDLALRVTARTTPDRIRHIPHVLYHWRILPTMVSAGSSAVEAARKALRAHFATRVPGVEVTAAQLPQFHRVRYPVGRDRPLVSAIVPSGECVGSLRRCVDGLLGGTDYPELEVLVVDTQSERRAGHLNLEEVRRDSRVRVLPRAQRADYTALDNWAAARARGEILAFLNNDLEMIAGGWLAEMVSHALRPEVGIVGAKLYYPSRRIRHAGFLLGPDGVVRNVSRGLPRSNCGHFGRACLIQNLSAVTAACMVLRKEVFERAGGFGGSELDGDFRDVDLCLRVRGLGYWIVWTPHAELCCHASEGDGRSRPGHASFRQQVDFMVSRWGAGTLQNDPSYNPNLSLASGRQFRLAYPPRSRKPWLT